MKKLVLVLVAMFPLLCFSQNIIVANGNNSNTSNNQDQEECPYRINGICSTEDIGGVEFEFIFENNYNYLRLINYNNTTVSVLFELDYKATTDFGCNSEEGRERVLSVRIVVDTDYFESQRMGYKKLVHKMSLSSFLLKRIAVRK